MHANGPVAVAGMLPTAAIWQIWCAMTAETCHAMAIYGGSGAIRSVMDASG